MAKQTFTTGQVLTAAQMTSLQQTAMGGGSTTAKTTSYVLVAADAGTVVQMNAAGSTTITVNTALFSAGDTVQIQNVGAGVCTITAGTATVNTSAVLTLKQYDAGTLYFNSTSAAIFFAVDAADSTSPLTTKGDVYTFSTVDARLPVGTNNYVLTADSTQATGLKWAATGAPTFSGLSMSAANTSITTATYTALPFATEQFDTDSYHDTATNNTRVTIPTGKAGYYQFNAFAYFSANATGTREVLLYKNGALFASSGNAYFDPGTDAQTGNISAVVSASVADYFELFVWQSSGAGLTVNGRLSMSYLGA